MGRNYKEEYRKFQSGSKNIKKRSKLNKINRDKGTYGNGDGLDVSHMKGGSVKLEPQSKNRGNGTRTPGDRKARGKKNYNDGGLLGFLKKNVNLKDGMLGGKNINLGKNTKGGFGVGPGLDKFAANVTKNFPSRNMNLSASTGYKPDGGFNAMLGIKKRFDDGGLVDDLGNKLDNVQQNLEDKANELGHNIKDMDIDTTARQGSTGQNKAIDLNDPEVIKAMRNQSEIKQDSTASDTSKFVGKQGVKKKIIQPALQAGLGKIGAKGAARIVPGAGWTMLGYDGTKFMTENYAKAHNEIFGPVLDEIEQDRGKKVRDMVDRSTHSFGMPDTYNRKF